MRNRLLLALAVAACLLSLREARAAPPPLAELFGQETGLAVAIDPQTGKTILQHDPAGLLSDAFPPGSLVKVFTAIAALDADPSLASLLIACEPSKPTVPVFDACWYRPGHGTLDMKQALAASCDKYFRALAERTPADSFFSVLRQFSLAETAGRGWTRRDAAQAMVGIGTRLRLAPLSLLAAYASLFNGGCLHDLSVGEVRMAKRIDLRPETAALIRESLAGSAVSGTAAEAGKDAYLPSVAAKTGTASYLYKGGRDSRKTHGWFIGLVPAEQPRAAVCVFLLEGTGADAARIGVRVLRSLRGDGP